MSKASEIALGLFGEGLDQLAPGVLGYTSEIGGALVIPLILAENPGNGDVGRYLDSLPRDRDVICLNVISDRMAGMLERRGWRNGRASFGQVSMQAHIRQAEAAEESAGERSISEAMGV